MNACKTPEDLARYIRERAISAELVFPSHETPTVPLAAQAMGCSEDQIIKSVLFLVKDDDAFRTVLVITSGTAPVDFRKLAAVFDVGRKRIRLAPAEVVLEETGYPAGGVPPFGFDKAILTFIDESVLQQEVVYGGGGDDRTLLRLTVHELQRVTGAAVIQAR